MKAIESKLSIPSLSNVHECQIESCWKIYAFPARLYLIAETILYVPGLFNALLRIFRLKNKIVSWVPIILIGCDPLIYSLKKKN